MKKLYNSPQLEIVKFTAMEAMADSYGAGESGDIYDTLPEEDQED